jgi:hypothetical protein
MFPSLLAILNMVATNKYEYIFFPIVILVWIIYSFFDEDDREYLRRNGIDADEISWFFPDYNDYGAVRDNYKPLKQNSSSHIKTYPARKATDNSRYAPKTTYNGYYDYDYYGYASGYSNTYKKLKDKCKRNFKITIAKNIDDNGTDGL